MAEVKIDIDVTAAAQKAVDDMLSASSKQANTKLNALVRDAVKAEVRTQVREVILKDENFQEKMRGVVKQAIDDVFSRAAKNSNGKDIVDSIADLIVQRLEYGDRY